MPRITSASSIAAVALALSAGAAPPAMAQCSVFRTGMPDFDQQRSALPNDGRMYCVPTATANALAYISNHGYPGVFGGPRDWQSAGEYGFVNTHLILLGALMRTDPQEGTGMAGWRDAARAYTNNEPGFVVGSVHASEYVGINPLAMANHMRIGSIVMPVMGWYVERDTHYWERTGGHMVTMWGGTSLCGAPQDMRLIYRDPANDGALFAQGDFATTTTAFSIDPLDRFKYQGGTTYYPRLMYQLDANGGFLDGFGFILPAFGLTTDPITQDIEMHIPLPLTDDPGPKVFPFEQLPEFTSVISMAPGLLPTQHFVITQPDRVRQGTLHLVDAMEGKMEAIDSMTAPRCLATGRHGEVYVAAGGDLLRYVPAEGGGYTVEGKLALPAPADAMVYDDRVDEMVVLCQSTRRLLRVGRHLQLLRNDAIPAGVALDGDGSVLVNPEDGGEWIACSGSPSLTRFGRDPFSGRLLVAQDLRLEGVSAPHAAQFGDDGVLYVVQDHRVRAFEKIDDTTWGRAGGPLDGMRTGNVFAVGRGRTNYDPALMDDANVLPPDIGPGELDCLADLDHDGALTVFDFLAFQNLFAAGSTTADFDHDGELTIFDFLAYQNLFAGGC
ncbi:MAG: GC-type dockerin domain-anchored protein [Phycisphaerales bacterium JB060]